MWWRGLGPRLRRACGDATQWGPGGAALLLAGKSARLDERPQTELVIVGGGTAGAAALEEVLHSGFAGRVVVLERARVASPELRRLLARPEVAERVRVRHAAAAGAERQAGGWMARLGAAGRRPETAAQVEVVLDTAVRALDAARGCLVVEGDATVRYDRCLIATGRPRALPPASNVDKKLLGPALRTNYGALPEIPRLCRPDRQGEEGLRALLTSPGAAPQQQEGAAPGGRGGQRHHVTVLGNGVDALALAANLAMTVRRTRKARGEATKGERQVALVTHEPSPLARLVPGYVWGPLERRARRIGVDVMRHVHVRYILKHLEYSRGSREASTPQVRGTKLYLSCVYDSLDTSTMMTSAVAMTSPDRGGGLPAEPPFPSMKELRRHGDTNMGTDHVDLLVCPTTGIIHTDASLNAAPRIWVAGSATEPAAPHPNAVSGGVTAPAFSPGPEFAADSGRLAAHNMLVDAMKHRAGSLRTRLTSSVMALPGEDCEPYSQYRGCEPNLCRKAELFDLGVSARWIGRCDTRMESHGFWYRPLKLKGSTGSMRRRSTSWSDENGEGASDRSSGSSDGGDDGDDAEDAEEDGRAAAAAGDAAPGPGDAPASDVLGGPACAPLPVRRLNPNPNPVLGVGVVYFMEPGGRVGGVLLWGLDHTLLRESPDEREAMWRAAEAHALDVIQTSSRWRRHEMTRVELMYFLQAHTSGLVEQSCPMVNSSGALRPIHRYAGARASREADSPFHTGKSTRSRSDIIADAYSAGIRGRRVPTSSDGVNASN